MRALDHVEGPQQVEGDEGVVQDPGQDHDRACSVPRDLLDGEQLVPVVLEYLHKEGKGPNVNIEDPSQ